MYKHSCIKPGCSKQYDSEDAEAYYCESCNAIRLQVAKEVDQKLKNRPAREIKSALKEYEEAPKVRGFMYVKL